MEKELEEYYLKKLKEFKNISIRTIQKDRRFKSKKEIDLFFSSLKTMSNEGNKVLDEEN